MQKFIYIIHIIYNLYTSLFQMDFFNHLFSVAFIISEVPMKQRCVPEFLHAEKKKKLHPLIFINAY